MNPCHFLLLLLASLSFVLSNSDDTARLQQFAKLTMPEIIDEDIEQIAVVRLPGTPAHTRVRNYITNSFSKEAWLIEELTFTEQTPMGPKNFTNIVVTFSPLEGREEREDWSKEKVIMACHYDSKYYEEPNQFVGAIDSAVPCSLLLDISRTLEPLLLGSPPDYLPQFVFFDGEEAFGEWSEEDSLYGSRKLAQQWNEQKIHPDSEKTVLSNIGLFVLFDLLGGPEPAFHNHFKITFPFFEHWRVIEKKLRDSKILSERSPFFKQKPPGVTVDDDHRPFLNLGVPVFLVMPIPFPTVWHTFDDTVANLDKAVIYELATIFRIAVADMFRL